MVTLNHVLFLDLTPSCIWASHVVGGNIGLRGPVFAGFNSLSSESPEQDEVKALGELRTLHSSPCHCGLRPFVLVKRVGERPQSWLL